MTRRNGKVARRASVGDRAVRYRTRVYRASKVAIGRGE
jgi:hypothetical protein